jgi:hypothetical protein
MPFLIDTYEGINVGLNYLRIVALHHRASFASKCIKMQTKNSTKYSTIFTPSIVPAACPRLPSFFGPSGQVVKWIRT